MIVSGFVGKYASITESIYGTLIGVGLSAFLISLFFLPEKTDRLFARGVSWYGVVAAPVLSLALMGIYVTRLFPSLPAEFGGPELSRVNLDIKRSDLSEATVKFLTERPAPGRALEMIRSRAVDMLSPPGRYYLIALENAGRTRFVKINTESIHAITPSDDCVARNAEVPR